MLGQAIKKALTKVGVTEARVETWLGAPCNCEERRQKLDQLGMWAMATLRAEAIRAGEFLTKILGQ